MLTLQEKERSEGIFVPIRALELEDKPIDGSFDLEHLKKINYHLFQDLPNLGPEYAKEYHPGEFRKEVPAHLIWKKPRQMAGIKEVSNIVYSNMDKQIIEETAAYLKEIDIDKLKAMRKPTFAKKMSEIYTKLDYLHPFPDGNSRTIREFTRTLARKAGYELNWEKTNLSQDTRNELYIARDVAVNKIAHEKMLIPEGKYDIEMYMKPFKGKKTLTEILSDNVERIKVKKRKLTLDIKPTTDRSRGWSR